METEQTYQVGDYYLTQNRQGKWCRTWYDPQTKQRKTASLRTGCFESAKSALDNWFIANAEPDYGDELPFSQCAVNYYSEHAQFLTRADEERRALSQWVEFFPGKNVLEIRPVDQRQFIKHLVQKGYAKSTIETTFRSGTAAINYAWRDDKLSQPLPITSLAKALKGVKFKTKPRWRPISMDEMVMLFDNASTDRVMRYIMVLMATGSRPGAALELEGSQIDLDTDRIDLLPDYREQNNKYRPVVKLPSFIRAIYHEHNICSQADIDLNRDRPGDSIKSSWRTTRKRAGLDNLVTAYSIRHTVARWLRLCGVQSWETSGQMGHVKQGSEITEIYASFDPAYLSQALEAIEGYFALVYSRSERLRNAEWLSGYKPRCDLVAKYSQVSGA